MRKSVCNIYVLGIYKIYIIDLRWSFLIHVPHVYVGTYMHRTDSCKTSLFAGSDMHSMLGEIM